MVVRTRRRKASASRVTSKVAGRSGFSVPSVATNAGLRKRSHSSRRLESTPPDQFPEIVLHLGHLGCLGAVGDGLGKHLPDLRKMAEEQTLGTLEVVGSDIFGK